MANLAYLDIAVALSLWREWKLSELLEGLVRDHGAVVALSNVVAALTVQRCVAPGSKLAFQRWLPRSTLPELLGLDPAHMSNSRVHRVLTDLDKVEVKLQEGLACRYAQRDGTFATLFTDVSDAWFEGRGPDLAERTRTREGLPNRYKVGLLLLCTERGYPLRWKDEREPLRPWPRAGRKRAVGRGGARRIARQPSVRTSRREECRPRRSRGHR